MLAKIFYILGIIYLARKLLCMGIAEYYFWKATHKKSNYDWLKNDKAAEKVGQSKKSKKSKTKNPTVSKKETVEKPKKKTTKKKAETPTIDISKDIVGE